MPFRFLDHTGDVAFEVEAESLPRLVEEAVAAFAAILTESEGLAASEERQIEVVSAAPDLALLDLLEELLYLFEVDGFLPVRAAALVDEPAGRVRLRAAVAGQRRDPARHPLKVLIKAVTYHGLVVEPRGRLWFGRVVFDI